MSSTFPASTITTTTSTTPDDFAVFETESTQTHTTLFEVTPQQTTHRAVNEPGYRIPIPVVIFSVILALVVIGAIGVVLYCRRDTLCRTKDSSLSRNASGYYETVGPALPTRPPEMVKVQVQSKSAQTLDVSNNSANTSPPQDPPSFVPIQVSESPYIQPQTTPIQGKEVNMGVAKENEYLTPLPCPKRDESYIELDLSTPSPLKVSDATPTNHINVKPVPEPLLVAQTSLSKHSTANIAMQDVDERLETFRNYPQWNAYRIKATAQQIADAGWYCKGEEDKVCCWSCGGGLQQWEENDDPWEEHAKWFPTCEYLQRRKGTDFVNKILMQHRLGR